VLKHTHRAVSPDAAFRKPQRNFNGTCVSPLHSRRLVWQESHLRQEAIMAVKILIKRRLPLDENKARYIVGIFRQLRMLALEQKGYMASETLRSIENPQEFLVISTWQSLEDWQKWFTSSQRKELHSKVDMLLEGGTTYEVYQYGFLS
jgi:heme-degrading monooxygenase HmoA